MLEYLILYAEILSTKNKQNNMFNYFKSIRTNKQMQEYNSSIKKTNVKNNKTNMQH